MQSNAEKGVFCKERITHQVPGKSVQAQQSEKAQHTFFVINFDNRIIRNGKTQISIFLLKRKKERERMNK